MKCSIFPLDTLKSYKYSVVLSFYQGKLLLSRHRQRSTWETQGGHIEPGEMPLQAAARELEEESGAIRYRITPLCDYAAGEEGSMANGMVYIAQIEELGAIPDYEMAEICLFEYLPENLTYPEITPCLYKYWHERRDLHL